MSKQYSKKFWIIFWSASVILLAGFWFFLEIKNRPISTLSSALNYAPWLGEKEELRSVAAFAGYLLKKDNEERTFLILFQNNMELRPGGGFIGTFGILKVKNGQVMELATHDLSNFDAGLISNIDSPYPIEEILGTTSWKLRDSNWSPDFSENAKKAEYLYHLGKGQENFDGIVAINTNVLTSFLKVTGPISIPGYPGTYDSENAILTLEYQVEKGYAEQGIEKGERKSVMNELASAIMDEVFKLNVSQKIDLAKVILADLNKKDIQLYFKDAGLQQQARLSGWSGEVASDWEKDYLLMLDANLGAFKSDYYMKRKFNYNVDLTGDVPKVNLKITYTHTGKVKDWMTRDYLSYLRVYVPRGAWLQNSTMSGVRFGEDVGKKYFGAVAMVPLNQTKTFEFNYTLPQNLNLATYYNLLIQKQSGVENLVGHVTVKDKNGIVKDFDVNSVSDWTMAE